MHDCELDQVAACLQCLDDRQLVDVCFGEFCAQRAALHADDVSNLHSLRPVGDETSVVRCGNDLVDPVPVILQQYVCVGKVGVLRLVQSHFPGRLYLNQSSAEWVGTSRPTLLSIFS